MTFATQVVEHDPVTGKRMFTKREHLFRLFEAMRFRELRVGDYVAARVSSRDLWIVARVVQTYPAQPLELTAFLSLPPTKRDALFLQKVLIQDVEEKEPIWVARPLVLPLPRNFSEAADWGARLKKGCRVYAMYPKTTVLYAATVIDNTTYCQHDDDIIVVEFDEDERDPSGDLPKWHIPARFVTLIPKEFPSSQATGSKQGSKKRASTSSAAPKLNDKAAPKRKNSRGSNSSDARKRLNSADSSDSALNNMITELAGGMDEDDLDFNLGFTEEAGDLSMPTPGRNGGPALNAPNHPMQRYGS